VYSNNIIWAAKIERDQRQLAYVQPDFALQAAPTLRFEEKSPHA